MPPNQNNNYLRRYGPGPLNPATEEPTTRWSTPSRRSDYLSHRAAKQAAIDRNYCNRRRRPNPRKNDVTRADWTPATFKVNIKGRAVGPEDWQDETNDLRQGGEGREVGLMRRRIAWERKSYAEWEQEWMAGEDDKLKVLAEGFSGLDFGGLVEEAEKKWWENRGEAEWSEWEWNSSVGGGGVEVDEDGWEIFDAESIVSDYELV
ncbi:hypothetical protein K402DRAFT_192713 [Aulographum hederae CBS 113979]|uniref:Uncharacterized protein n=1 Tax=Aulographum hederae CBS 113979 TaxID=1176131 RepID=A0A6G1GNG5_9PEZI|nr:hypothetical protein K402DRAFT_192713 [Aulographum hederae CBS 113979]